MKAQRKQLANVIQDVLETLVEIDLEAVAAESTIEHSLLRDNLASTFYNLCEAERDYEIQVTELVTVVKALMRDEMANDSLFDHLEQCCEALTDLPTNADPLAS